MEMELIREQEYFLSICHLCNGHPLPFPFAAFGLIDHICKNHLPLKCDKCLKIFENSSDLKEIGKCSHVATVEKLDTVLEEPIQEQKIEITIEKESDGACASSPSKLNLTTNKCSMNLCKIDNRSLTTIYQGRLERQTSTPMISAQMKISMSDPSASAIQISSINSTSGTSLDSDISPMQPPQSRGAPVQTTISPKRNAKRQKMAVEATPLRQLMSKSIQRAMAEHGHYRQSAFIGQRKMSFNSSNSSDSSLSLQRFQDHSTTGIPLDLRLSPAIRRNCDLEIPPPSMTQTIEIKQIEVFIRQSAVRGGDTTTTTNYRSCFSETGRSESMPEMHFTPKLLGNNMLKKTISFETPRDVERTPKFAAIKENADGDDEEVFYTPTSSPVKMARFERKTASAIELHQEPKQKIWTFVRKLSENITESLSNENLWKFQFKKPEFIQKAGDFFKRASEIEDEQPLKRRRTSSSTNRDPNCDASNSPAHKRAKIQGRKPINRMRKMS